MTPEEIFEKYGDPEPLVGAVTQVRVSPNRLRIARPLPQEFASGGREWISIYFQDRIGLTVSLLSQEDVADWTVLPVER